MNNDDEYKNVSRRSFLKFCGGALTACAACSLPLPLKGAALIKNTA
jgi:hypothetical protein